MHWSRVMTLPTITAARPPLGIDLQKDLKQLALFIQIYCRHQHAAADKRAVSLHTHDVRNIAGRDVVLCAACTKLLAHACVKRTHCPYDPKPMCKHCPTHCYHPTYRAQIRDVMKFSGRYLVCHGRLDYLWHLLF
jgi:predicted amidophosphoribosyltransferase